MTKRILSLLIALCLFLAFPIMAWADEETTAAQSADFGQYETSNEEEALLDEEKETAEEAPLLDSANPNDTLTIGASDTALNDALPRVVDSADLLTPEEEQLLEAKLSEIRARQQFDVVVLTEQSLDGKSPMAFADDYYDYNGYGYGAAGDGCLLLLAMDSRDWWISTKGYGITALTDYGIQYVGDEILSDLKDGDYYGAFSTYADRVDTLVTDAKNGNVFDTNNDTYNYNGSTKKSFSFGSLLISFVISLIAGLIARAGVKGSYKPVKFNRSAANYLVGNSLQVTQSYDNFLYSNVTSHRIESDSSSSGGGSSTHTSSSGSSHGGGGGKF